MRAGRELGLAIKGTSGRLCGIEPKIRDELLRLLKILSRLP